jgi:membrane protease YdiL (CAAX protease family)
MASAQSPRSPLLLELPPRRRRRVLAEIVIAYALILAVIWTPRPAQRWLWWIAAASVVFFTCVSFDGVRAMGLRPASWLRSMWVVPIALLIAGIAVAVAAAMHTLRNPHGVLPFIAAYWAYALWAFAQQFLLQSFFLLRFLRLFPTARAAAIAAAAIFALAHLPNPILTPITFVWGLAACLIFLRRRNLYPLALAHAIFGITIAIAVPGPVDHNMRVGWSYLTYSPHFHRFHPR